MPPIGEADERLLIEQICHGATSYKEIKDRPVWPVAEIVAERGAATALDQLAPERIKLPNDRKPKSPTAPASRRRSRRESRISTGWPNGLTIGQRPRAAADRGPGAESSPDPDHGRSDHFLAGGLSEDQDRSCSANIRSTSGARAVWFDRVLPFFAPDFVCLMSNFVLLLRALSSRGLQAFVPKMRIEGRKNDTMCEIRVMKNSNGDNFTENDPMSETEFGSRDGADAVHRSGCRGCAEIFQRRLRYLGPDAPESSCRAGADGVFPPRKSGPDRARRPCARAGDRPGDSLRLASGGTVNSR